AVTHSDAVFQAAIFSGDAKLGVNSLSDLAAGSSLDLSSGRFSDAARVVENSISQVLGEQARLGTLQGQFTNAINNSQSSISTLATADADITSIDAASEVTNFTQAQLGLNLATSILRGSTIAQQTVLSLLQ
ncbi:MAG: flagellin, partial [Planctomycetota bacterium]